MKRILIAALLAGIPFAAHAQMSNDYNWAGVYLGGHGGYMWASSDWQEFGPGPTVITPEPEGFLGGALLGFQTQGDHLVVGLEGDISFGNVSDGPRTIGAGGLQRADVEFVGTVRGRIGVPMGAWMPFVTGGVGVANVNLSDTASVAPTSAKQQLVGYVVGGGLDMNVGHNLTLRAEYMYGHYDTATFAIGGTPDPADLVTHVVRGAVTWRPDFLN